MKLNTALLTRPWSCHAPRVEGYEPTIDGTVRRMSLSKRNAWRVEVVVDGNPVFTSHHDTKAQAESKCAAMLEAHTNAHYKSKGEPMPEATPETRPTLTFDGMGINGPDEYRTRIATFSKPSVGQEWGRLFERSPEMLVALKAIRARIKGEWDNPVLVEMGRGGSTAGDVLAIADAAISLIESRP